MIEFLKDMFYLSDLGLFMKYTRETIIFSLAFLLMFLMILLISKKKK